MKQFQLYAQLLICVCCLHFSSGTAASDSTIWSVQQAYKALQTDELVLLDIRSRQEWKETGVAENALPVSMHEKDFGKKLSQLLAANSNKKIALICAVGGRSGTLLSRLQKMGLDNFVDVSEGMLGSRRGRGWIASGLPVVSLEQAERRLPDALRPTGN